MLGESRKRFHLVDDEIMAVPVDRRTLRARVRVWRTKDEPAIVLVEQLQGGRSPSLGTCKFATRIWRDLLHYSPLGMRYFEAEGNMTWIVSFDVLGVEARAVFMRPSYTFYPRKMLDAVIASGSWDAPRSAAA